jgi:hypothetical protein
MMMPRGRRNLQGVRQVVMRIFQRNMEAWEEDDRVLSNGVGKEKKKPAKRAKPVAKGRRGR